MPPNPIEMIFSCQCIEINAWSLWTYSKQQRIKSPCRTQSRQQMSSINSRVLSSSLSSAHVLSLDRVKCVPNLIYWIDIEYEYDTYGPFDWIKWFLYIEHVFIGLLFTSAVLNTPTYKCYRTYFMISFTQKFQPFIYISIFIHVCVCQVFCGLHRWLHQTSFSAPHTIRLECILNEGEYGTFRIYL